MKRVLDETTIDLLDTLVEQVVRMDPFRHDAQGRRICVFCTQPDSEGTCTHTCRCPWYLANVLNQR